MNWMTKSPTESGWYWTRSLYHEINIVYVGFDGDNPGLRIRLAGNRWVSVQKWERDEDRMWAGPIPPPNWIPQ